jgi:hypothetical protein
MKLNYLWDIEGIGYRLKNLTKYDIFSVRSSKLNKQDEKPAQ